MNLADHRIIRRVIVPLLFAQALIAAAVVTLFVPSVREPVYDAMAAGRKPLVIVNGQTQQLQAADWISTVGGLTTNATAPAAGDVQTTTFTASGLSTLTGGFTLGADSSAGSHKITSLTNGSSAQDAAAFGQLATAINAAVSGTTNKMAKFTGTNTVGVSSVTDDGSTWSTTLPASVAGLTNTGAEAVGGAGVLAVALSATQNNWNPTGLSTARIIDITPSTGIGITGIAAQPTGTLLTIRNVGPSTVVLSTLSGSSSSANQFANGATLTTGCAITYRYGGSNWVHHSISTCAIQSFSALTASGNTRVGALMFDTVQTYSTTGAANDVTINSTTTDFQYNGAGNATFTGMAGCNGGRIVYLKNISGGDLTLNHQDAASAATNRYRNPGSANIVVKPNSTATYICVTGSGWLLAGFISNDNAIPTRFSSTQNSGTITLAAGTGTATVPSGSTCVCTDTTATNVVKCAVSSTTVTATGTGTDVIAYHCF